MLKLPYFQQKLVNIATNQLSKTIHTEVNIGRVDFSLFNTFNLKDVLIRDEKKDTLVYAGKLSINLTDWFFTRKQFTVYSFGLENAKVHLKRTDSIWNHAFIAKAFSSKNTSTGQPSQLKIDIKSLDLKNVHFLIKDGWRGEDQSIQIGQLYLKASEINLAEKRVLIQDIYLANPLYKIFQYTGNRPDSLIPVSDPNIKEHWNKEGWYVETNEIQLENGLFQLDVEKIGT